MSLSVSLRHSFDGFTLDLAFESGPGVTALFGRSGAGKTTVINAVAGLLNPQQGRIELNGRTLLNTETGENVQARQRRIGYVFQDARLFPHMSVRSNLRFGSRFAPNPPTAAEEIAVVDMLGIGHLLSRRPGGLSGGEQSRVALGRALLCQPDLLLMDEPLAALDGARKDEILPYLERLRDAGGTPILYVSHAMDEIARLADTLILLDNGRIARSGPASEVLSDPSAVPLIGVREAGAVLLAKVAAHEDDGLTRLELSGGTLLLPGISSPTGSQVRLRVLAQDIILAQSNPQDMSALNCLSATVTDLHLGDGPGAAVALQCGDDRLLARITARSAQKMGLQPGSQVYAILKATAVPRAAIGTL